MSDFARAENGIARRIEQDLCWLGDICGLSDRVAPPEYGSGDLSTAFAAAGQDQRAEMRDLRRDEVLHKRELQHDRFRRLGHA